METLSNAANSASKMIWGDKTGDATTESGQEPISGEQGKGTVEEPFDRGNEENPTSNPTSNPITNPSSSTDPTETPGPNLHSAAAGDSLRPEHKIDKIGVVGGMGNDPKASDVHPTEASSNTSAAPESTASPTQKQQGAERPGDAPTGEEAEGVKEEEGEQALKKDLNDHPGEPMHMHDAPKTQAERRESKVRNASGQEHGKEKGTGEKWVKTSGLAADGGDFDATKPGAGREADRLMEQKGIHKTFPGEKLEPSSNGGEKEKVGLSEKIKNKLHIGSKDK